MSGIMKCAPSGVRRILSFDAASDFVDFGTYYAASIAVSEGNWASLYPRGIRTAPRPSDAPMDSELIEKVTSKGGTVTFAYMYTPFVAPLFLPLSFFDYKTALHLWMFVCGVLLLCSLSLLRREVCACGCSASVADAIVLLAGINTSIANSFRGGNIEIAMAFSILLSIHGICNERDGEALGGFFLAGATKGVSAIWIPLLFAWKKWNLVVLGSILAVASIAGCFFLGCSWDVFRFFFSDVLPASQGYSYGEGFRQFLSCMGAAIGGLHGKLFAMRWSSIVSSSVAIFALALIYVHELSYLSKIHGARMNYWADAKRMETALALSFVVFQFFRGFCPIRYRTHLIAIIPALLTNSRQAFKGKWMPLALGLLVFLSIFQVDILVISAFGVGRVPFLWMFGGFSYITLIVALFKTFARNNLDRSENRGDAP